VNRYGRPVAQNTTLSIYYAKVHTPDGVERDQRRLPLRSAFCASKKRVHLMLFRTLMSAATVLGFVSLGACSQEGSSEKAGEDMDSAIEEATQGEIDRGDGALGLLPLPALSAAFSAPSSPKPSQCPAGPGLERTSSLSATVDTGIDPAAIPHPRAPTPCFHSHHPKTIRPH
jgi:hypothetical protein